MTQYPKKATQLAKELTHTNNVSVLKFLSKRDEVVLRCRGDYVLLAAAFSRSPEDLNVIKDKVTLFPKDVSFRLWNMYALNQDFDNKLDEYLSLEGDKNA